MDVPGMLKALDLFCGAGGASMGLHRAGFDVTGVDIRPQPRYPFTFVQADVLTYPLDGYDLVWASPPCQMFTAYRRRHYEPREPLVNLIPDTRQRVQALERYVIENVPGSPLKRPIMLCGSMFGLDVRRHRLFETNFVPFEWLPPCNHGKPRRFLQATNREQLRRTVEVGCFRVPLAVQKAAMGIDWMSAKELSQAIPPAYAEWIGKQALG